VAFQHVIGDYNVLVAAHSKVIY